MKEEVEMLRRFASRISLGERLTSRDADDLTMAADRIDALLPRRERTCPPLAGESDILRRLHWFRYSWASSTMDQIIAGAAIDEIRKMYRRLKEMESRGERDMRRELYDGQG